MESYAEYSVRPRSLEPPAQPGGQDHGPQAVGVGVEGGVAFIEGGDRLVLDAAGHAQASPEVFHADPHRIRESEPFIEVAPRGRALDTREDLLVVGAAHRPLEIVKKPWCPLRSFVE